MVLILTHDFKSETAFRVYMNSVLYARIIQEHFMSLNIIDYCVLIVTANDFLTDSEEQIFKRAALFCS